MAYFAPYIDGDGIHIPTYKDILDSLLDGYQNIFGSQGEELYLGEETQDYQALSLFAKCMDDHNALVVENYNSRNPNYASGDALDLILQLNAMKRKQATRSTVTLTLAGRPNAVIPEGTGAVDDHGYIWYTTADVTLDATGAGTVEAACSTAGPIIAEVGEINQLLTVANASTADAGLLTSVTNEKPAVAGSAIETDAQIRARRKLSVSMKTNGTDDALRRALAEIPDMLYTDLRVNDFNVTDPLTGIPGHSICALVMTREFSESETALFTEWKQTVAKAIWLNKAPGIGTYGNISDATYTDDNGHVYPVYFSIPVRQLVTVEITIMEYTNNSRIVDQQGNEHDIVTLRGRNAYDPVRLRNVIKNAVIADINSLGVGMPWNVTMAYKDIYDAMGDEALSFVVRSVEATTTDANSVEQTSASYLDCAYDCIFYTDADHVILTEEQPEEQTEEQPEEQTEGQGD